MRENESNGKHSGNGGSGVIEQNRAAARASGLKYVSDEMQGLTRVSTGRGVRYARPDGSPVRDPTMLKRIERLVIPPAWREVWICPDPRGHIQVVGRDERGRKQYLYHERWREARDRAKYNRLVDFALVLPKVRRAIKRHLAAPGLKREKVLAAVLAVMEKTLIRIGNDEYAGQNGSFGLTTLRDHHVEINGKEVCFDFKGKSGIKHEINLEDPKLANIIRKCRDLPGIELFQYLDDEGQVCDVGSNAVNEYLRQISGADVTTKDFRTWAGTVLAARALGELEPFKSPTQAKRNVTQAVRVVAARLGNTAAVCRKCYIHPAVLESYLKGLLSKRLRTSDPRVTHQLRGLRQEERAVLSFLRGKSRSR
jgi:DNA topoisomerase-1